MKDIITLKGEKYSFDEDTGRIFKDGYVLSSSKVEPVYSSSFDKDRPPVFSGIYLKDTNSIVSLSGKINPVTDINTILK